MTLQNIFLAITALTTALIAGLFYAWTCSVIPGLAKLSNTEYVKVMQTFNLAIQNPLFFFSFLGTSLLLPFCCFLHFSQPLTSRFWLLLAASAIYLTGVLGVTVFGNIPLNESLATFGLDAATSEAVASQRAKFEIPWNRLNAIRTLAAVLSIFLVILACLSREE